MSGASLQFRHPATLWHMKLRSLIIVSAAVLIGVVDGVDTPAQASSPRLGAACSTSQIGKVSYSKSGQKLRCTSTGATGVKWVRTVR